MKAIQILFLLAFFCVSHAENSDPRILNGSQPDFDLPSRSPILLVSPIDSKLYDPELQLDCKERGQSVYVGDSFTFNYPFETFQKFCFGKMILRNQWKATLQIRCDIDFYGNNYFQIQNTKYFGYQNISTSMTLKRNKKTGVYRMKSTAWASWAYCVFSVCDYGEDCTTYIGIPPELDASETTTSTGIPDNCGVPNRVVRIVGGVETETNEFPWVVRLQLGRSLCGGTIISDQYVLTAAHCTDGIIASNITIYVGDHDYLVVSPVEVKYFVQTIIQHADYTSATVRNDISLLKTTQTIEFNTFARPICLPRDTSETYANTKAIVAGWGTTASGGSTSNVLLEVEVPVLSNVVCLARFPGFIYDTTICAGEAGVDSCQGDSGGPLFSDHLTTGKYEIIGIASWGVGCGDAGNPGVYARVSEYIENGWLSDNMV